MKLLPAIMAIAFAVTSFSAVATEVTPNKLEGKAAAPTKTEAAAPKKLTAQQEKMKFCNKKAKEQKLKGADRKTFMKTCLKKDDSSTDATTKSAGKSGKESKKARKAAETAPAAQ